MVEVPVVAESDVSGGVGMGFEHIKYGHALCTPTNPLRKN